jgi:hypothetical protein
MKNFGGSMIDASFSRQRHQEDRGVAAVLGLPAFAIALAIILIGLGGVLFWAFGSSTVAALPSSASAVSAPAREQVSNEILETAMGLISVLIGVLVIVVVGAICFWAIDKFANDRRLANLLKLLVVLICLGAILQRVLPLTY